jgi:type II restriction enzyme
MLNSLIGSTDLRKSVEVIWNRDKSAFQVMDILIAVRSEGKKKILNSKGQCIVLDRLFDSVDGVMEFIENTGLADIFRDKKINDLVDYVFGIETGLDTNARKNRSGHVMENAVANIFRQNNIPFRQEVYSTEWPELQQVLGDDEKRFDFVVTTPNKTYLIEVNFYSGGGSKLNEVARSYSDISPKINSVNGFEFVWITDGIGWKSAKNKLQEAYSIIPSIYNLTTISDFISTING